jgi:hypothetical protein
VLVFDGNVLTGLRASRELADGEETTDGVEPESRLDEGLRIEWNEIGLVAVDVLVVSGVERAGFFRFERQITEALTGVHFSWAQDQVIGVHGADRALGTWRGRV